MDLQYLETNDRRHDDQRNDHAFIDTEMNKLLLDMDDEIRELYIELVGIYDDIHSSIAVHRSKGKNSEDDIYLNSEEVMKLICISKRTLFTYRQTGRIPFYKLHGKILYKKKEIIGVLVKEGQNIKLK
ncbi:MAG: helix-turn-helix domain-containing protein [Bacteroidales bacterium]|jgi:hypothetical protein